MLMPPHTPCTLEATASLGAQVKGQTETPPFQYHHFSGTFRHGPVSVFSPAADPRA